MKWKSGGKKEQLVKLGGDQNPSAEATSRSSESKRGRNIRDVMRGVTARQAMEKDRSIRVINMKKVKRDNPFERFFLMGFRNTF